jgi:hypothetical protein
VIVGIKGNAEKFLNVFFFYVRRWGLCFCVFLCVYVFEVCVCVCVCVYAGHSGMTFVTGGRKGSRSLGEGGGGQR